MTLLHLPEPAFGRFPGRPHSFVVMNRAAAEGYVLDEPHVLISIASATVQPARHPALATRVARLRIAFDDADYDRLEALRLGLWADEPPPDLFDREHAVRIRDFVDAHRAAAPWIACHCEAGMSRSPAVAVALSRWLNGDDEVARAINRWIAVERLFLPAEIVFWNRLVHDRLLAVLLGDDGDTDA